MRWHHVRTAEGWEIRDENGLLVASLVNPAHDREDDARLIAEAPATREQLDRLVPNAEARKERLIQELVDWIESGWVSGPRGQHFHHGVRVLATQLKRKPSSVLAEIQAEAYERARWEEE